MGLESVTNLADLVRTNPTSGDPKSAGDDHLRNIKTALLNDFAGFPGAILCTGTDGGAVNAYTLAPAYGTLIAYGNRMIVSFSPTVTNTGATTLNISSLGAKSVLSVSGAALVAGELVAGNVYAAFYNGTEFRLLSVTQQYVQQLAFSAALPAQTLGLLISNGTVASFSNVLTGFALDEVKGANIASAATIDLSVATGNFVHVTGTTTITAITLGIGAERTVIFDGVLTLTHGAGLLLPGAANITTAANDRMTVRGDAAGSVVTSYTKADGTAVRAGLALVATINPTAAANIDFLSTFTAAYDNYIIIGTGITTAATDDLKMRFAVAGSVDAGSNYRTQATYNQTPGGALTTSLDVSLTGNQVLSGGKGLCFEMRIKNVNDATRLKSTSVENGYQVAVTPTYFGSILFGLYLAANAVSGVRFYWAAGGNFGATGVIRVYGYNNT